MPLGRLDWPGFTLFYFAIAADSRAASERVHLATFPRYLGTCDRFCPRAESRLSGIGPSRECVRCPGGFPGNSPGNIAGAFRASFW